MDILSVQTAMHYSIREQQDAAIGFTPEGIRGRIEAALDDAM